jgi:hypothetical protein
MGEITGIRKATGKETSKMMERTTSQVVRQYRIKGTQSLVAPRADLFAGEIIDQVRQGHYDRLPLILAKVADADELLAVRKALHAEGVPFDAVIPAGEPEIHAAFRTILKQSSEPAQSRFADALSLIELEAIGRFDDVLTG